jgi:hypothetical protein
MAERTVRVFGNLRLDTTDWPIVLHELPEERVPELVMAEFFAHHEKVMRESYSAREKSYHVIDLTRVREIPNAIGRKQSAEFVKRTHGLMQATSLGTGFVAPSAFTRGLMTAIFWLTTPPVPNAFFATRDQAYQHAVRVLDAAGVLLPPRLLELSGRRN